MTPRSLEPVPAAQLLRQAGLRPRKSLGQNFLLDERWLERVAEAADIQPTDTVLEVGAGLGSLTRHLALAAGRVLAVELDPALLPLLHTVTSPFSNIQIIAGDILELPLEKWIGSIPAGSYRVAANIPYYITSAVIRRLLESGVRPVRMVLTVQQEVAERICATPNDMNLLALSVQFYSVPSILGIIPAAAFYPAPNVESAIVCIHLENVAPPDPALSKWFFRLAKAGFSMKRKMLRNTLSAGMGISTAEVVQRLDRVAIDPRRRAETLSVAEWIHLAGMDWEISK
jgi:16S rRNA (adenine1518-N6/adenine1519-N6)-dimethyltransferase